MDPEILYEDEDILAINKPAGLVVHSDGRTKEPSVTEWFVKRYPGSKDVGEPLGEILRPGVAHRIDRETSGVLLLAKTQSGYDHLKAQFHGRVIDKIYHAFLYGKLKEDHGSINQPIARSKSDFRKRAVSREGKPALTYYRVIARGEEFTFVEAKPKTGRTHQIRVHFRHLHHPVVGDKLYARSKAPILGFDRLALHAREIAFADLKGQKKVVVAPYPPDFQRAVDSLN